MACWDRTKIAQSCIPQKTMFLQPISHEELYMFSYNLFVRIPLRKNLRPEKLKNIYSNSYLRIPKNL